MGFRKVTHSVIRNKLRRAIVHVIVINNKTLGT